jgi:mannose-6-phosphate isomerase-like protein (cupin superfamily)
MTQLPNHECYIHDIEKETLKNNDYRRVICTCPNKGSQVALMSLLPKEEIGMEKHIDSDQFIRIEKGNGYAELINKSGDHVKYELHDNSVIIIPANTYHNIVNSGEISMKLYTVYSKATHEINTIHHLKSDDHDDDKSQHGGRTKYNKIRYYTFKSFYNL